MILGDHKPTTTIGISPTYFGTPIVCGDCGQTFYGSHFCRAPRSYSWNGPVCLRCGVGYVGVHVCPGSEAEHLRVRVAELEAEVARLRANPSMAKKKKRS